MSRSLTFKLTRAFLIVSITGAVLAMFLARWMMVQAFNQLVLDQTQTDFVTTVTVYYQTNGSWEGMLEYFRLRNTTPLPGALGQPQPIPRGQLPPPNAPGLQPNPRAFVFMLADPNGIVIIPIAPYRPGDVIPVTELAEGAPIEVDGQVVGVVVASGEPPALGERETSYLASTNRALIYAGAAAAAVALFLGVFLARSLARPLRELTAATRQIAKGALQQRVPVRSQDEMGELAAAFNQMSADLERANEIRRQMTADIAHDLRTPLSVLGGYIEAMQDGILPPTAERLATMHTEIQHLIRLVDDLRTLSLADAGELSLNLVSLSPADLFGRVRNVYQHTAEQQGVAIEIDAPASVPGVSLDPDRMTQVLGNLVSNALRYTPAGGRITLSAKAQGGGVALMVEDTGQGIPADMLPHIFDRFYRGDESRQQKDGESGLGLAIAKSIVEAHGGSIRADSAGAGKGSIFVITLPRANRT